MPFSIHLFLASSFCAWNSSCAFSISLLSFTDFDKSLAVSIYIAFGEPYLSIIALITFLDCETALNTTGFKITSSNSETYVGCIAGTSNRSSYTIINVTTNLTYTPSGARNGSIGGLFGKLNVSATLTNVTDISTI